MKKQILICLLACATGNAALATNKRLTASPQSVITAYIDAFKNADAEILSVILDDDACIKMGRQDKVLKHTKKQLVQFFKKEKDNQIQCDTDFEIISFCDAVVIAAVDFKFESCTQRNYITIEKNRNDEWKVMGASRFFLS